MKLDPKLAQSIVDKMMKTIPYNINIMNEKGYIIASGDKSRINTLHVGAIDSIDSDQILPMVQSYGIHGQPGVNMPVKFQQQTIGVVGITGDPKIVAPLASLLKVATELLISQNYNNQPRTQYKSRLNRFLYQWLEVADDIAKYPELISEAVDLNIDLQEPRYVLVAISDHNSKIQIAENDYAVSTAPNKLIIITQHHKQIDQYLNQCCELNIKLGISQKNNQLASAQKQAQRTIYINDIFDLDKTPYYQDVMFVDQLLADNLVDKSIQDTFESLSKSSTGQELIDTLAYYLKCDGNISLTSDQLHIHRNTTNYRLNKISEIFKLNVHKLNDIFELYANYLNFKKNQYEATLHD
ncbi:CdaR family transcriptional regulator [Companilactobacillus furfuricola]|uniref:CdaR family transcriptional regulator n=1 Tax=Companilactobacillus furfuricola TaxID=1462575 RepID=UPI000F7AD6C6|nr:sugar diacid recognition domain-containing protein [Companilactobacillus furfuricola]